MVVGNEHRLAPRDEVGVGRHQCRAAGQVGRVLRHVEVDLRGSVSRPHMTLSRDAIQNTPARGLFETGGVHPPTHPGGHPTPVGEPTPSPGSPK